MQVNINKDKKINGRKILVKALVGSHNYNLADETSDKDYKVFVMPTFEELYKGKRYKWNGKIAGDDYDVKDIRDLILMWGKSNVAYLEILVSKDIWIDPNFKVIWDFIIKEKHLIANNNPIGMIKSMIGMSMEKRKAIEKDLPNEASNEGYKRRIEFGYDTKQLLHIYRLNHMLSEFSKGKRIGDVKVNNESMLNNFDMTINRDCFLDLKKNKIEFLNNKEKALIWANVVIDNMRELEKSICFEKINTQNDILGELEILIMNYIKDNL